MDPGSHSLQPSLDLDYPGDDGDAPLLEGVRCGPVVTLRTRKPVVALTAADLDAFPVWEFALDEESLPGRDETWVRPVNAKGVPRNRNALQVATDFRAACGRIYPGLCIVTRVAGQVEIQVGFALVGPDYLPTDHRQALPEGTEPSERELFPITYQLRVLVEGKQEPRRGTLP
jgi:hypothetical protein